MKRIRIKLNTKTNEMTFYVCELKDEIEKKYSQKDKKLIKRVRIKFEKKIKGQSTIF